MTEKEIRRLSRGDLLEMLLEQTTEMEALREKLKTAEETLERREILVNKAGSIAEASLKLNGVFEAAQAASQQYIDNVQKLSRRSAAACMRLEMDSRNKAEKLLTETRKKCETMEAETQMKCAEMVASAKTESRRYWDDVRNKLETFYAEHVGLRELLTVSLPQEADAEEADCVETAAEEAVCEEAAVEEISSQGPSEEI